MLFKDFIIDRHIYDNGWSALNPKISVVMPTFCRNAEGRLEDCVKSVLAQKYTHFEFIVIDDGSVDGTEEVMRRYADQDPRIVYVRHNRNSGLPAIRSNEGIMLARGDYVSFIFDDNIWVPETLECLFRTMMHSEVDVAYSNTLIFTSESHSFLLGEFPLTTDFLMHLNTIPNGTVLCRRDFFDRYGMYDIHLTLRRICDWDLWLRAYRQGATFTHVDEPLSKEYGPMSPVSIGSSVKWDYKVSYAYMIDDQFSRDRTHRLTPSAIGDYDVFDADRILQYLRSEDEWETHFKIVYEPFLKAHPDFPYAPPALHNHLFSNPALPWTKRQRILLASNAHQQTVEAWKRTLEADGHIVISCGDWQLSMFEPGDVDAIILLDAASAFLEEALRKFRQQQVPLLYQIQYGTRPANPSAIDYSSNPKVRNAFQLDLYFPLPGRPWTSSQSQTARKLMEFADLIIGPSIQDAPTKIPFITHADPSNDPAILKKALLILSIKRMQSPGTRWAIFLNSEMHSGAEAYGVQLADLLERSGIPTMPVIPFRSAYGVDSDGDSLRRLLASKGLPPPTQAPYRPEEWKSQTLIRPSSARQEMRRWLGENKVAGLICASFAPAVYQAAHDLGIPVIAAFFQPNGYSLPHVAHVAHLIDGAVSDSDWSCSTWHAIIGKPCATVRTCTEVTLSSSHPPHDVIRIAVGGTLQPRKRQMEIIRAVSRLINEEGFRIQLNLYGYVLKRFLREHIKKVENEIQDLGLHEVVKIHGLAEMSEIIRDNDVILSASIDESLPQTMLYAMARGMIGAACPAGGINELILDGRTGFLSDGFEEEHIRTLLRRTIESKPQWDRIRTHANEHIKARFSPEGAGSALIDIVNHALALRRMSDAPAIASRMAARQSPRFRIVLQALRAAAQGRVWHIVMASIRYLRRYGFSGFTRKVREKFSAQM